MQFMMRTGASNSCFRQCVLLKVEIQYKNTSVTYGYQKRVYLTDCDGKDEHELHEDAAN